MTWNEEQKKEIVALRSKGYTYGQIALETGRTRGSISAFISTHKSLFSHLDGLFKIGGAPFREKPTQFNTVIEEPPKENPIVEGELSIKFIDLKREQCKFFCEGFWKEPTNKSPCCGKRVCGDKEQQKNYCIDHYNFVVRRK